ncbi:winged helix-turn-helix transcriptional regulator [Prauserella cavernicola]|uniref:Helix-turn-helix transcriptional regulator n=1 Tax=Prauserella cavernicola TaxID=2800127 RepID=A0A934V6Q6_9PSEU|nr:helix-turn-helix domain-containing protein [Prauserella cavernicola]MBK1786939.1 helix-turn-helix transcriptional regulator [Prauserella cavernicola]
MGGYGQFCAVARALEILGERWTLLIVRELLLGERQFNDIRRGIPRISKTMLSARLKTLERHDVIRREDGGYRLTEAGRDLAGVVRELGGWAMRWDRRELEPDDLDAGSLVWDIRRRVVPEALPAQRTVVALRFREPTSIYYLYVRRPTVTLCPDDIGLPISLTVDAELDALTRYWIGELGWPQLVRSGAVELTGPTALRRAFPTWFAGYILRDAS